MFLTQSMYCQHAQNPNKHLVNFSTDDGLSQNSVYTIARTLDGFMWFGTNAGLNRFDGENFVHYKVQTKDGVTRSNVIFAMLVYKDGILVGTEEELLFFDPKTSTFLSMKEAFGLQIADKLGIKYLFMDSRNDIWILTINNGLIKYSVCEQATQRFFDDNDYKNQVTGITELDGVMYVSTEQALFEVGEKAERVHIPYPLPKCNIRDIETVGKSLWLAINDIGVLMFDPKTKKVQNFKDVYKGNQYPRDVTFIYSDGDKIWLGTRSIGMLEVDPDNLMFYNYQAGNQKNDLRRDFVLIIYGVHKDEIWIGQSGGGVARLSTMNNFLELFRPSKREQNHLQDPMVLGMMDAGKDQYYFGTLYGGLLFYDRNSGQYKYYKDDRLPVESKNIYGMTQVGKMIWMATWAGLCSFDTETKSLSYYPDEVYGIGTELYAIVKLAHGNKLLLSGTKGMIQFDLQTKKWTKCNDISNVLQKNILVARYMQEKEDGDIYISGMEDNFFIYNYLKGTFQFFPHLQKYGSSRCFYEEKDRLWIASDNGLIQTRKPNFNIEKVWTTNHGLANDFIYAVAQDANNNLYVSTNSGLSLIHEKTGLVSNFTKENGLQDVEFNSAAVLKNQKGELIFGGVNGVNFIPLKIKETVHKVPMPQIIKVNVLNKPFVSDTSFTDLRQIHLEHNQNFIDIQFISPNGNHDNKLDYMYYLEGVDPTWVDAADRNYVSYTQLSPGKYTFFVRAKDALNNESLVNNKLTIEIEAPFYATLWFWMLILSILCLVIFLLINGRINNLKRKALAEKTIAQLEMKALQSQMNPHFVFNCINGIYEMIISNENENARKYLKNFAALMRMTLENSKRTMISLDQTLNYLERYLDIEKIRLVDFTYVISVAPDVEMSRSLFPPMILQPLVENSVWHGLAPLKGKKVVSINLYTSGEYFICEIDDNGIGINLSKEKSKARNHHSTGLESIKEHIILLNDKYNIEITMDIYDKSNMTPKGQGTMVKLSMKYD